MVSWYLEKSKDPRNRPTITTFLLLNLVILSLYPQFFVVFLFSYDIASSLLLHLTPRPSGSESYFVRLKRVQCLIFLAQSPHSSWVVSWFALDTHHIFHSIKEYMEVSENRGTQKWMVFLLWFCNGKSPWNGWWLGAPPCRKPQIMVLRPWRPSEKKDTCPAPFWWTPTSGTWLRWRRIPKSEMPGGQRRTTFEGGGRGEKNMAVSPWIHHV